MSASRQTPQDHLTTIATVPRAKKGGSALTLCRRVVVRRQCRRVVRRHGGIVDNPRFLSSGEGAA